MFFNVNVFNDWLLVSSVFQFLQFPPRVAVVSGGVVGLDGGCRDVFLSGPRRHKAYFSSTALAAPAGLLKRPSVLMCQTFSHVSEMYDK